MSVNADGRFVEDFDDGQAARMKTLKIVCEKLDFSIRGYIQPSQFQEMFKPEEIEAAVDDILYWQDMGILGGYQNPLPRGQGHTPGKVELTRKAIELTRDYFGLSSDR